MAFKAVRDIQISMTDSPLSDLRIGLLTSQWAKSRNYPCTFLKQIPSTNVWAKEHAGEILSDELPFHLVITDLQTKGRGRGHNTWSSPPEGSALLSSWCFSLGEVPQPHLTFRVGLAFIRSAMSTWPFADWSLKAPNDLLLDGSKVAGILTETLSQGPEVKLIIGIGMNVFETPKDIDDAVDLQSVLPPESPLLGQDWVSFLERFFMELTEVVSLCGEPLSSTDQMSLLHFLNLNPNLEKPITKVFPDGSMEVNGQKICAPF